MAKPNPIAALPEEDATPSTPAPDRGPPSPPPAEVDRDRIEFRRLPPGGWGQMPDGCPVTPLGHKDDYYFFLTARGGFKTIRDKDFSKAKFTSLYEGNLVYLMANWPRVTKEGDVTQFHGDVATADHMKACHDRGPWDPSHALRGVGCHRGGEGELIWNLGDVVLICPPDAEPQRADTRTIGEHIYLLGRKQVRPAKEKPGPAPAQTLLGALSSWNWARGALDARLLLGWIVAAMLGGALSWRPLIWITGDKGTGKSTLNDWLEYLFGTTGLVRASDATAAGIWQSIKFDSLPVALDEVEATIDNRKTENVINLARQAASGGLVLRGGQDHAGVEFTARSCFSFSSINIPPLSPQDMSRLAILELGPLEGKAPPLDAKALHELGGMLRRRIIDQWRHWDARFLAWRNGLIRLKHAARTADQFGTLLAAADLVLADKEPSAPAIDESLSQWRLGDLAEQADETPDWHRCVSWLTSEPLDVHGRNKTTVAKLLTIASGRAQGEASAQDSAAGDLALLGLKLIWRPDPERDGRETHYLAIANDMRGTDKIFENSHWRGKSGALPVFVRVLRRVPGAVFGNDVPSIWFNGHKARVTLLPLDRVLPKEEAQSVEA